METRRPGRCAGRVGVIVRISVMVPARLRTHVQVVGSEVAMVLWPSESWSEVVTWNGGVVSESEAGSSWQASGIATRTRLRLNFILAWPWESCASVSVAGGAPRG